MCVYNVSLMMGYKLYQVAQKKYLTGQNTIPQQLNEMFTPKFFDLKEIVLQF